MKTKLVSVLLVSTLLFMSTGCFTQSVIATLITTLGNASASIATIEGNPTLAAQLKADTAAAAAAVLNWQNGSASQDVIEALGIVEDDLNLLPFAGPYIPLITLALATIQEIIALVTTKSPTPVVAHTHKVQPHIILYSGKAPKKAKDFKAAWNKIALGDSRLAPVAIP
jgi:TctA family transporter